MDQLQTLHIVEEKVRKVFQEDQLQKLWETLGVWILLNQVGIF